MKDFVLAMLLAVLGEGAAVPTIEVVTFDNSRLNGHTTCVELSPVCLVQIDKQRWRDRRQWGRYTEAETTVIHELCHVRVHQDLVRKHVRDGKTDARGARAFALDNKHHHGKAWQRCMRRHKAEFDRRYLYASRK